MTILASVRDLRRAAVAVPCKIVDDLVPIDLCCAGQQLPPAPVICKLTGIRPTSAPVDSGVSDYRTGARLQALPSLQLGSDVRRILDERGAPWNDFEPLESADDHDRVHPHGLCSAGDPLLTDSPRSRRDRRGQHPMRRKLVRLVFVAQCVWLVLFVDDRATVLLEVARTMCAVSWSRVNRTMSSLCRSPESAITGPSSSRNEAPYRRLEGDASTYTSRTPAWAYMWGRDVNPDGPAPSG